MGSAQEEERSASIAQRIDEVAGSVAALRADPGASKRARLRRRLHALALGARAVGMQRVAQRVGDVEAMLDAGGFGAAEEMRAVDDVLALLPELARADEEAPLPLGGTADVLPASVCVVGREELAAAVRSAGVLGGLTLQVTRVPDCGSALALREPIPPELFVVDVDLPGASELLTILVDDPRTELVPTIAVARATAKARLARWTALGVTRTFVRPFDAAELRLACVETIEQRRGRTQRMLAPPGFARSPQAAGMPGAPPKDVDRTDPAPPVIAKESTAAAVGSPADVGPIADPHVLAGRRVIVADADPVVAWFFADLLRKEGCLVDEAIGAERALECAFDASRTELPHLVVADAALRAADGSPLALALRRDAATRDVPILLLSSYDELLDGARAANLADAYLQKSATSDAFIAAACELTAERDEIWSRVLASGRVTGNLDGVSVSRLVWATRARRGTTRIVLTAAGVTHEMLASGGALRHVTRRSRAARLEVGVRASATALGTTRASFLVEPAPEDALVAMSDADLLGAALECIRATAHAVASAGPERLLAVRLDPDAASLLDALDAHAAALAGRLAGGASPRLLVTCGEASTDDLSVLLGVLCRRGIVIGFREELPDPFALPAAAHEGAGARATAPRTPSPAPALSLSLPIAPGALPAQRDFHPPAPRLDVSVPLAPPPRLPPPPGVPLPRAPSPWRGIGLFGAIRLPPAPPPFAPVASPAAAAPVPAPAPVLEPAPLPIPQPLPVYVAPERRDPLAQSTQGGTVPILLTTRRPPPRELTPPPSPGAPRPVFVPALAPAGPLPEPVPAVAQHPNADVSSRAAASPLGLSLPFEVPGEAARRRRDSDAPVAASVPPLATKSRWRRGVTAAAVAIVAMLLGTGLRWSFFKPGAERRALASQGAPSSSSAPTKPQGVLELTVPEGTAVIVDGIDRGHGPKLSISLAEGSHEVKTTGPDAKTRNVEIARGKITHVDLAPKGPAAPR